ncbi:hypothetical protein J7K99_00400 [bacterium]|nr:hypothetical protein [bacterium]
MVAQTSATVERYIEFIGEDSVAGGICRIDFPEKFRKVISIGEGNPVEIFITPYSPLGEYWVERGDSYFVLHCSPGVSGEIWLPNLRQNKRV